MPERKRALAVLRRQRQPKQRLARVQMMPRTRMRRTLRRLRRRIAAPLAMRMRMMLTRMSCMQSFEAVEVSA